jgi:hypothetical protein
MGMATKDLSKILNPTFSVLRQAISRKGYECTPQGVRWLAWGFVFSAPAVYTIMTNDILEQIAEDYFRSLGYFTQHNVKYRLDKGVHSDIDLLAIHPKLTGVSRVAAVSCKSWQGGLDIATKIKILEKDVLTCTPRELKEKNLFREFSSKNWATALTKKVLEVTGQQEFEFYTIVTLYHHGDKDMWENIKLFQQNLPACKLKLIDLKEMIQTIWPNITTTPEHSELTRLLQLIKADNGRIVYQ